MYSTYLKCICLGIRDATYENAMVDNKTMSEDEQDILISIITKANLWFKIRKM